ncbi:MAG: response regulator [Chloroflexi bacterium]|nr:response regulator [Chloroflexota bacterium]
MKKILVIEDTLAVLEEIVEMLEMEGFDALGASDGLQGIQMAREHMPALIVCDIMMPEIDGYEVLRELRGDSATATIPFIFLTARVEREDMRKGMELGADDYLTKPFSTEELLAAIQSRFEKQHLIENERLRMLSHRLVEVQEAERRHIAHELHTEIGQLLTGLKVSIGMAKRLPSETIGYRLDEAQALINELLSRVSELSLDLRPPMLDDLGLLPTLLQHFRRYTGQTQVRVDFRHAGLERRFASKVETTAYRVVQEALTNIARHTSVASATVQIWVDQDVLNIHIEDQGEGFQVESTVNTGTASGIFSMYERVTLLGGDLAVKSAPGSGTRISAWMPIEETETLLDTRAAFTPLAVGIRSNVHQEPVDTVPKSPALSRPEVRLILADPHDLIRQGIRSLLSEEPEFAIVGEAKNSAEIEDLVAHYAPDVLLLDYDLGLDVIGQVAAIAPDAHVLVMSMHDNEAYALASLRNGATGYVLKETGREELVEAVREIADGRRYLSHSLAERVIDFYINTQQAEDITLNVYGTLTSREREIFHLVVNGAKNAEIADKLVISPRTVETHRANMMRKLGLRTQADLIRYAIQHGIISVEE